MKRLKKLTRKQRGNAQQLFNDLAKKPRGRQRKGLFLSLKDYLVNQTESQTLEVKPAIVEPIFSLKEYFANKAEKRLEKLTQREEKRQAKADKIAIRIKLKAAQKAAREAKEAKKAARLAKKQELSTK